MKYISSTLAVLLFLQACNNATTKTTSVTDSTSITTHTKDSSPGTNIGKLVFANEEGTLGQASGAVKVGEIISYVTGKFNDANRTDTAYVIKTKQGDGAFDSDDYKPDEYEVRFTDDRKAIKIDCCDARVINEGDLNNDGIEEVSVFQYPENGTVIYFRTYANRNGKWNELIEPFMIPAAAEEVTDSTLQDEVINRNGIIYYNNYVDTNEAFIPVKTKATVK